MNNTNPISPVVGREAFASRAYTVLPPPFFHNPLTPYGEVWLDHYIKPRPTPADIAPAKAQIYIVRADALEKAKETDKKFDPTEEPLSTTTFVGEGKQVSAKHVLPWLANSMNAATKLRNRWDLDSIPEILKIANNLNSFVAHYSELKNIRHSRIGSGMNNAAHGIDVTYQNQHGIAWLGASRDFLKAMTKKTHDVVPSYLAEPWHFWQSFYQAKLDDKPRLMPQFNICVDQERRESSVIFKSYIGAAPRNEMNTVGLWGNTILHTANAFRALSKQDPFQSNIPTLFANAVTRVRTALPDIKKHLEQVEQMASANPSICRNLLGAQLSVAALELSFGALKVEDDRISPLLHDAKGRRERYAQLREEAHQFKLRDPQAAPPQTAPQPRQMELIF